MVAFAVGSLALSPLPWFPSVVRLAVLLGLLSSVLALLPAEAASDEGEDGAGRHPLPLAPAEVESLELWARRLASRVASSGHGLGALRHAERALDRARELPHSVSFSGERRRALRIARSALAWASAELEARPLAITDLERTRREALSALARARARQAPDVAADFATEARLLHLAVRALEARPTSTVNERDLSRDSYLWERRERGAHLALEEAARVRAAAAAAEERRERRDAQRVERRRRTWVWARARARLLFARLGAARIPGDELERMRGELEALLERQAGELTLEALRDLHIALEALLSGAQVDATPSEREELGALSEGLGASLGTYGGSVVLRWDGALTSGADVDRFASRIEAARRAAPRGGALIEIRLPARRRAAAARRVEALRASLRERMEDPPEALILDPGEGAPEGFLRLHLVAYPPPPYRW